MAGPDALNLLVVYASNRCNQNCPFCYEVDKAARPNPTLEEVEQSLARRDPAAVASVIYMGAETLLRPDALELVRRTRQLGFPHVAVVTNGTTVPRPEALEALLEAGLMGLEVSIQSLDPDTAARLSGRPDTAAKQERFLGWLADLAPGPEFRLTINTVLCAENLEGIPHLVDALHHRLGELRPLFHLKYPSGLWHLSEHLRPARYSHIRELALFEGLSPEARARVSIQDVPLCAVSPASEHVDNLCGFLTDIQCEFVTPGSQESARIEGALPRQQATFLPACSGCEAQPVCCGFDPDYAVLVDDPQPCVPLTRSPEELLTATAALLRDWTFLGRRDIALDPATAAARARLTLPDRLAPPQDPAPTPKGGTPAATMTIEAQTRRTQRQFGPLASRLPELFALRHRLRRTLTIRARPGEHTAPLEAALTRFCTDAGLRLQRRDQVTTARYQLDAPGVEAKRGATIPPSVPACCAEAARQPGSPTERWTRLASGDEPVGFVFNPFLRSTPFHLCAHLPCSLACRATRDRASELHEAIGREDPDLARQIRQLNSRPVLLLDTPLSWIVLAGERRGDGVRYGAHDVFHLRSPNARSPTLARPGAAMHPWLAELSALLDQGDRLDVHDDRLLVTQRDRRIGELARSTGTRWALFGFR